MSRWINIHKIVLAMSVLALPLSFSPLLIAPAQAQSKGVTSLLGNASDGALD